MGRLIGDDNAKKTFENRPDDALGTLVKLVRCCKILQNCGNWTKYLTLY